MGSPDRQAERLAALGAHQGFAKLRQATRAEWRELWKGRILLHGAGRGWQQRADAAFFLHEQLGARVFIRLHLHFGLATWHDYHYYYGHVMWDIETFSVPPLSLLQPETAAALPNTGSGLWKCARTNAQAMGRRGIQFPWNPRRPTVRKRRLAWHRCLA